MGGKLRIVVADDDPDACECLRRWLGQLGHDVRAVGGGADLIGACRAGPPDLVVSGVEMPDVDGITAAGVIRRQAAVPVILISRAWDEGREEAARAAGVTHRLSKPLRALELVAAVEAARRPPAGADRELLRRFVDDADGCAILTTDPAGRVGHWNRGAERLFGLPAAEAVGGPWEALFTPEDARAGVPARELRAAAADGHVEHQRWHPRRGGGRFWGAGVLSPVRGPGGETIGYGLVLRDATVTKEREELILARGVALWEAEEKRATALATLAHELRNQLTPVANYAHALRARAADPSARVVGERIEQHVREMAAIVDDVFDAECLSRGKARLARRRVDAREVVGRAADEARPAAEAAGHDLAVALPGDPLWVDADPGRLNQVMANLLTNAVKYTPAGGRVGVHAGRDGGDVVLRVRDTGLGIPPDQLESVFELYSQLPQAAARTAQGGLGIGLALVRELVTLHGGTVRALSDGEGTGSEFVIRLPAAGPA